MWEVDATRGVTYSLYRFRYAVTLALMKAEMAAGKKNEQQVFLYTPISSVQNKPYKESIKCQTPKNERAVQYFTESFYKLIQQHLTYKSE